MARLTPKFSANRAVREYTEGYYLPAAANYLKRAAKNGNIGKKIVSTGNDLRNQWKGITFGESSIDQVEGGFQYTIPIRLNALDPHTILIQLYANGSNGGPPEIIKMEIGKKQKQGIYSCHAHVKTIRPKGDYTVRIIPNYEGISVPLEDNLIRWQH